MKKVVAMCFKTNKPEVYAVGTPYEHTCDTFLDHYCAMTLEEAQKEAERINREKPEKLWNGTLAHCDERTYFAAIVDNLWG